MRLCRGTWLAFFAALLAASLCEKPISKKDKKRLLKTMATWEDAPMVSKILDGTVSKTRGTWTFRYSLERDDGTICKAIFVMSKAIKGASDMHSIQCGVAAVGEAVEVTAKEEPAKQVVDGQEMVKIPPKTEDADDFETRPKSWYRQRKGFGDFELTRELEPESLFDPVSHFEQVHEFKPVDSWFRRPKGFWDEPEKPYRTKDLWDEEESPFKRPKKYFDDPFYQLKKDFWGDDFMSFTKSKSFWDFGKIPVEKHKGRWSRRKPRNKKGLWDYVGGPIRKIERLMDGVPLHRFGGDFDGSGSDDSREAPPREPFMKDFFKWME